MSYRAFKRLIGETNLEWKCLCYFGGCILILIAASFWLYAYLTERLAYSQIDSTGQLLVVPLLAQENVAKDHQEALKRFHRYWKKDWPAGLKDFKYRILKPDSANPEHRPENPREAELLEKFAAD